MRMEKNEYISEIGKIKEAKNAIILAHYYQTGDIQDIADYTGDSLALAQAALEKDAKIILLAGVKFMAETAKILNPGKKVLIPDKEAGCSLSDSCRPEDFKKFIEKHTDRKVVTYINTTAEIKAMSDIVCTSSNALEIVNSFPVNEKLIFAPDRNLGNYIKGLTNRDIILWDGVCHVHEAFSVEGIISLKKQYKEAKIIVHPECELPVRMLADYIGSTAALLKYSRTDQAGTYIVVTEPGIIHQMIKENPDKKFIPAPPKDSTCGCSECNFMKMNTVEKIYLALLNEEPEIVLSDDVIKKAYIPIMRMLEISSVRAKKKY